MKGIPQEIRVSSMVISFMNDTETSTVTPSVIITGAVITTDGDVHEFSFDRGKLCFKSKQTIIKPFDKTTQQRLEYLLVSYSHGALRLNKIPCDIEDTNCTKACVAELEDD